MADPDLVLLHFNIPSAFCRWHVLPEKKIMGPKLGVQISELKPTILGILHRYHIWYYIKNIQKTGNSAFFKHSASPKTITNKNKITTKHHQTVWFFKGYDKIFCTNLSLTVQDHHKYLNNWCDDFKTAVAALPHPKWTPDPHRQYRRIRWVSRTWRHGLFQRSVPEHLSRHVGARRNAGNVQNDFQTCWLVVVYLQ